MRSKGLFKEPFRSVYLPPDTPVVERDLLRLGSRGSGLPLEVGIWKPGGAGRQTQLFAGQRSESSALGGSNSHPREPLFREAVTHLQVLGTKQL